MTGLASRRSHIALSWASAEARSEAARSTSITLARRTLLHALEAHAAQRPMDRLSLGVQDARAEGNLDPGLHEHLRGPSAGAGYGAEESRLSTGPSPGP